MDYYFISAKTYACGCLVGINQAPILKDFTGNGASIERSINSMLLEGKNILNISAFWPPEKNYQGGEAEVHAQVFLAKKGINMPTPENVLAELSFPNETAPEVYPRILEIEFEIKNHTNPLLDDLVAKEELTASDKKEITNTISKFAKANQSLDAERIWELGKRKYLAAALANGMSESTAKSNLEDQMKIFSHDPGSITLELDFENTVYHPAYNRKIYFVHTIPNMRGTFKLGKEGKTYGARFEIGVGFASEGWKIVI